MPECNFSRLNELGEVPRRRDDGVLRDLVREPLAAEDLDALHAQLSG